MMIAVTYAQDEASRYDFRIDGGVLGSAINELHEVTGIHLWYDYELTDWAGINPVVGRHTVEEALDIMLRDTGLSGGLTASGMIVITREYSAKAQHWEDEMAGGRINKKWPLAGIVAVLFGLSAAAQDLEPVDDTGSEPEVAMDEIVVTGTNIRGLSNQPSPLTVIDREQIDAAGFATTHELLRNIPQNLNSEGGVLSTSSDVIQGGTTVNLRGLGTGATLILVNGRRITPGSNTERVDVSLIPLSIVERVEILTDGASAIYGSDAIAGVVNFILRDDFDGAETRLRFGSVTEGSSEEYQASQSLGQSWESGGMLATYEYYRRNNLATSDRSFALDVPTPSDLIPSTVRHGFFLTGKQTIANGVQLFADAAYSEADTENTQTSVLGSANRATFTDTEVMQYSGTLGVDIGLQGDWNTKVYGAFSTNELDSEIVINDVVSTDGFIKFSIWSGEATADGPVLSAPGGDAMLAIGGQYRSERFENEIVFFGDPSALSVSRDIYAVFGELYFPLVGEMNRTKWIHALEFTAAGRYEDYSDFGSTFDPKLGLRIAPTKSFSVRATYGTSFKAPRFIELNTPLQAVAVPGVFFAPPPGEPAAPNIVQVGGGNTELDAEQSESWAVGFDYLAPMADHLAVSFTYFDVSFDDRIGQPLNGSLFSIFADPTVLASELLDTNPAQSEIDALFELPAFFNFFGVAADTVGAIASTFIQNTASTAQSGFDFSISYSRETRLGQLGVGLTGIYILEFENQLTALSDPVDVVNTVGNPVDFRLRGNIGLQANPISGNLFINFTDDYTSRITGVERPVDSLMTVDLNFQWDLDETFNDGLLQDSEIAVTVQNVFDEEPPFVERVGASTPAFFDGNNASPLGRFIALQLKKKF